MSNRSKMHTLAESLLTHRSDSVDMDNIRQTLDSGVGVRQYYINAELPSRNAPPRSSCSMSFKLQAVMGHELSLMALEQQ